MTISGDLRVPQGRPQAAAGISPEVAFWIAVGLVAAAYLLPVGALVNRPFYWTGTLFHELGHGLGALVTGGSFDRLVVAWNGSGYAVVQPSSSTSYLVLLATGLLGPAIAGAIGFVLARGGRRARVALAGCALLLAWAIAFKVRSSAGLIVAVPICAGSAALAVRARAEHVQVALMVLSVMLALNSWQHRHYMLSSSSSADITKIANIVGAPVWAMGALCVIVSLAVIALGVVLALRGRAHARHRRGSPRTATPRS